MCVCCNIIQLYCMHVVLIVCCCMYMLSVLIAMCCMHVVLIVCCCVVCVVCIYSCCCTYVCTGKEERLWPIVRLIIKIKSNQNISRMNISVLFVRHSHVMAKITDSKRLYSRDTFRGLHVVVRFLV